MKIRHIIMTRFSVLPAGAREPHAEGWLEHRLKLFETYCLPSIASQTSREFSWLVFCDESTSEACLDRLSDLGSDLPQLRVVLTTAGEPSYRAALGEIRSGDEVLLTSRIDSDDVTSRDFVERVQAYAEPFATSGHRAALLSFQRGYKLRVDDGRLFEIWNPHSAHLSLFERLTADEDPATVQSGNHGYMQERYPLFADAGEPTWIQVVHGGNVSNRILNADPEVPAEELGYRFAFREAGPRDPVLPVMPTDPTAQAEYRQALEDALLGGDSEAGAVVRFECRDELRALLREYVSAPDPFWESVRLGERQAKKLRSRLRALDSITEAGADPIEELIALAEERASAPRPSIQLLGLGGSGSNWLAEMLADLPGYANAGEVGFPRGLFDSLKAIDATAAERRFIFDAVQLLHARGRGVDVKDQALINPAGGMSVAKKRLIDPHAVIVYLVRDPRDQVVAVAQRKPGYKKLAAADLSDIEYLAQLAATNRRNAEAVEAAAEKPDLRCRYEQLIDDPVPALRRITSLAGSPVSDALLSNAAAAHDSAAISAGKVAARGNLSSETTKGWRTTTSEQERRVLHTALSPVVEMLGYPMDECFGRLVPGEPLSTPVEVELAEDQYLGSLYRRSGEGDWIWHGAARGKVVLERDYEFKLRVRSASRDLRQQLGAFPAGSLHSICLAEVPVRPDEILEQLPVLSGLRELDLTATSPMSSQDWSPGPGIEVLTDQA